MWDFFEKEEYAKLNGYSSNIVEEGIRSKSISKVLKGSKAKNILELYFPIVSLSLAFELSITLLIAGF